MKKILYKLFILGFCRKDKGYRPIAKSLFTVLNIQDIITRFNYMIRGSANNYIPVIDTKADYIGTHYILQYSCSATIAKKLKSKISLLRKKFGKPLKITIEEFSTYKLREGTSTIRASKSFLLVTYLNVKESTKKRRTEFHNFNIKSTPHSPKPPIACLT